MTATHLLDSTQLGLGKIAQTRDQQQPRSRDINHTQPYTHHTHIHTQDTYAVISSTFQGIGTHKTQNQAHNGKQAGKEGRKVGDIKRIITHANGQSGLTQRDRERDTHREHTHGDTRIHIQRRRTYEGTQ